MRHVHRAVGRGHQIARTIAVELEHYAAVTERSVGCAVVVKSPDRQIVAGTTTLHLVEGRTLARATDDDTPGAVNDNRVGRIALAVAGARERLTGSDQRESKRDKNRSDSGRRGVGFVVFAAVDRGRPEGDSRGSSTDVPRMRL